jgi:peptidoglycan hydrolase-like protein with peptidoglycan-binding domain
VLTSAALVLLLSGCGGGDSADEASTEAGSGSDSDRVKLYFTSGEQFRKVERDLPATETSALPAVRELVEGPTEGEAEADVQTQTQIPAGVSVEDVTISDSGEAVVELSPGFTRGIPAEPGERDRAQQQELDARLAQVTYTLTQFDDVESAKVVAGGEVVEKGVERIDYAAPAAGPKPIAKPLGAKAPGVRRIQLRLAALGYLPKSAVDGLDGYRTEQAVMAFQAWQGLDRDGDPGPATVAELARATRPKPRASGPARRIEVHREKGVTLLIKGGRTKRAVHSSSGGPGNETPAGTYRVFRKELQSWSVPFSTWLPYASYFYNGIAFHEYPDVPPFPASHGCVRIPAPEAPGVYEFARLDTTVVVF